MKLHFIGAFAVVLAAGSSPANAVIDPPAYMVIIATSHAGANNAGISIASLSYNKMSACEAARGKVATGGGGSIYTAAAFCIPK